MVIIMITGSLSNEGYFIGLSMPSISLGTVNQTNQLPLSVHNKLDLKGEIAFNFKIWLLCEQLNIRKTKEEP